jgi:hypothetical protein
MQHSTKKYKKETEIWAEELSVSKYIVIFSGRNCIYSEYIKFF